MGDGRKQAKIKISSFSLGNLSSVAEYQTKNNWERMGQLEIVWGSLGTAFLKVQV